jgi:hypothetical protein
MESTYFPVMSALMLSLECTLVIALRCRKLGEGGPQAVLETHQMIAEKILGAITATGSLASGGTPGEVVAQYRATVAANSLRLR